MNYVESSTKALWKAAENVFIANGTYGFIRLAGINGAMVVGLGAYGHHVFLPRKDLSERVKKSFITANQYHFLHTLALLAVPITKRPHLVGGLMTLGMSIFCGTCYMYSLGGYEKVLKFTPYGGYILIISWLAMVL